MSAIITRPLDLALRGAGLLVIGGAWMLVRLLARLVQAAPASPPTPAHLMIAAGTFLAGSIGAMLVSEGAGLLAPVLLPARWSAQR